MTSLTRFLDLLRDEDLRITAQGGSRWLVRSNEDGDYVVYDRPPYAKKTGILYSGPDFFKALYSLVENNE